MPYLSRLICLLIFIGLLPACAPKTYPILENLGPGQILETDFITRDGSRLPLKKWQPEQQNAKAVIVALHGFNDYRNFFQQAGEYFAQHGIVSYAYDQRGFGAAPNTGLWAGVDSYRQDLILFVRLLQKRHPDTPIFVLGESMGAAVAISAAAECEMPPVDGIILSAPAIWGRHTMPWYQTSLLWLLSHTVPWMTLTGESLEILPSDNIDMLRALGKDPLVIKETRVEAVYGLVNLMDSAFAHAASLTFKTLLLYGEKDEVIPKQPMQAFLHAMKQQNTRIIFYKNGYHMLLRDLQATVVMNDIKSWIFSDSKHLSAQTMQVKTGTADAY